MLVVSLLYVPMLLIGGGILSVSLSLVMKGRWKPNSCRKCRLIGIICLSLCLLHCLFFFMIGMLGIGPVTSSVIL